MPTKLEVIKVLDGLAQEIHANAVRHGFWPDGKRNIGEAMMLIVTELGEGFEAYRKDPDTKDDHLPNYPALAVELADVIIRTLDLAEGLDYPLSDIIAEKMAFNEERPYLHGKQF